MGGPHLRSRMGGGTPSQVQDGGWGTPISRMGGNPISGPGWGGTPISGPGQGVPHVRMGGGAPQQVRMGGYPITGQDGGTPTVGTGWGYLHLRLDSSTPPIETGCPPPLIRRSGDRAATWRAI